ncbi:TetR/AcrR family transcriptional regulator [uncultured Nevskia sp.]|uniref:TetR/AcrR family transcriptional regulator n=1 Tax=uncultured Nevskia sp. TaxID=228950 RepID=UPI0025D67009|nr:TetR/AcrR family transcriptional regulator [uncultured Nevskia sp.]
MNDIAPTADAGQRGPTDHTIRDQIVTAAGEHFSRYGYGKTTVSDLASSIGFSKAYIYKFFESKQAIGEAICSNTLASISSEVMASIAEGRTATDKLRRMFKATVDSSAKLFFDDRKLYDIAAYSSLERWGSSTAHQRRMFELLQQIVLEGRAAGEFERKTPLDETCRAIFGAMQSFMNPVMLQHNLDRVPEAPNEIISLILRSLAP